MHPLTLDDLAACADDFDRSVDATPGIDRFCSSSDWVLPAAKSLMPPRRPWVFRGDSCYIAMMRGEHPRGFTYAEPLEAMWGLACPVIGADVEASVDALQTLCCQRIDEWDVLILSGLPVESELLTRLEGRLSRFYRVGLGPKTVRHVAELGDDLDAFLARRSRNFRRSLRRASARAAARGLRFECATGSPDELFARIQAVEERSWKGQAAVGIESGAMRGFYRRMLSRLMKRGAHRLLFARLGERDVAYVLGGVHGGCYRGLQFSFDADHSSLSLGNLCQLEQIRRLIDEGVREYDLGTAGLDYKRRWAEHEVESLALMVVSPAM